MKGNNFISEKQKEAASKKKKERRERNSKKQSQSVMQIMNGDFLTKDFVMNNMNYIFFVIFLMVLIVSKGYYVNQLANDIAREEIEVEDITADYVETKAKLEELTQRSQMVKRLEPLGLREAINPTKVIKVKKAEKK
ncbi:MAG TPA: FtsL-like putative cell division protein [Brumimicrobium sp.]|nr:FtsL-like putative cell division protein [Brumimicrobium sp.]